MEDDEYEIEFDEEGDDAPTAIRVFRDPVTDKHDISQWIAGYEAGRASRDNDVLAFIRDFLLGRGEPAWEVEPILDFLRKRLPGYRG